MYKVILDVKRYGKAVDAYDVDIFNTDGVIFNDRLIKLTQLDTGDVCAYFRNADMDLVGHYIVSVINESSQPTHILNKAYVPIGEILGVKDVIKVAAKDNPKQPTSDIDFFGEPSINDITVFAKHVISVEFKDTKTLLNCVNSVSKPKRQYQTLGDVNVVLTPVSIDGNTVYFTGITYKPAAIADYVKQIDIDDKTTVDVNSVTVVKTIPINPTGAGSLLLHFYLNPKLNTEDADHLLRIELDVRMCTDEILDYKNPPTSVYIKGFHFEIAYLSREDKVGLVPYINVGRKNAMLLSDIFHDPRWAFLISDVKGSVYYIVEGVLGMTILPINNACTETKICRIPKIESSYKPESFMRYSFLVNMKEGGVQRLNNIPLTMVPANDLIFIGNTWSSIVNITIVDEINNIVAITCVQSDLLNQETGGIRNPRLGSWHMKIKTTGSDGGVDEIFNDIVIDYFIEPIRTIDWVWGENPISLRIEEITPDETSASFSRANVKLVDKPQRQKQQYVEPTIITKAASYDGSIEMLDTVITDINSLLVGFKERTDRLRQDVETAEASMSDSTKLMIRKEVGNKLFNLLSSLHSKYELFK